MKVEVDKKNDVTVNVHVYLHGGNGTDISEKLEEILSKVLKNGDSIMAVNAELDAFSKRVDAATDNIAADIAKILANPSTVLSEEDRTLLETSVAKLEALASTNE